MFSAFIWIFIVHQWVSCCWHTSFYKLNIIKEETAFTEKLNALDIAITYLAIFTNFVKYINLHKDKEMLRAMTTQILSFKKIIKWLKGAFQPHTELVHDVLV